MESLNVVVLSLLYWVWILTLAEEVIFIKSGFADFGTLNRIVLPVKDAEAGTR